MNAKKDKGIEMHIKHNTILGTGDIITMKGRCTEGEGGTISIQDEVL